MSDPLILPVAAIISGIVLARTLTLSGFEAAWPVAAFLVLALVSSRWLRRVCLILALIFVGAFAEVWHRPGPRPHIDAGSRETMLLAGCVVEPSVLSPGRQQFTLETRSRRPCSGDSASRRRPRAPASGIRPARRNRGAPTAAAQFQ